MSAGTFKVPNGKNKKSQSTHEGVNSNTKHKKNDAPLCLTLKDLSLRNKQVGQTMSTTKCGILPLERRVTRGSVRASQESHCKPWSELPGLRLRFAEACSTSDYGTASESSYNCSSASGFSPGVPCNCENMSGVGCIQSSSDDEGIGEPSIQEPSEIPLDHCSWNSDSESDDGISTWDDKLLNVKILSDPCSKITAIIPVQNSMMNESRDLNVRVLSDPIYKPKCGIRMHHVSPVVSLEPHGIQFRLDLPVYLSIPVNIEDERHLVCLFSNTHEYEQPRWEKMCKKDFRYRDGFVVLIINHFSLFTVMYEEPYPESLKRIRRRMGGTLRVDEVPGVEISFPRGCLDDDVDAYLRVFYDSEPSAFFRSSLLTSSALASPIIMIGPHGHQFDPSRPAVVVTLPVPDLDRICHRFGIPINEVVNSLSIWQSPTMESEPITWERLNTQMIINLNHSSGVPVVSFQVHHFSFFTVIWDILSTSLYEAKMGMAYYYPYITFSMMCEAFMQETPNTNR